MLILDDYKYIPYEGTLNTCRRWSAIFFFGLECTFKRKFTIALIVAAWLSAIIQSIVFILLSQGQLDVELVQVQGERYFSKTMLSIISIQFPWLILLFSILGSGLIADDLKKGAYQIYFARPITRWDYFTGKILVGFFYTLILVWMPVMLLFFHSFIFSGYTSSPNWKILSPDISWTRFFQISLYLFVLTLSINFLILAFSSLSKNSKFIALAFLAIPVLGKIFEVVSQNLVQFSMLRFLSYLYNLEVVGFHLLRLSPGSKDIYISLSILILLILSCMVILYRRLGRIIFVGLV